MNFLKKYEQTIVACMLVIINFIVKGIFLSSNSLANDEPFSVYHAQMDIASIIKLLSEGNNPPLYEILLHLWIKLFGISEFSVRFPSLVFSSITVLYLYKLGRKYLNKQVALYASIVFIFSNYHILFAHEARVYALLGMLSVISMYYFMGIIQYCTAHECKNNALKHSSTKKLIMLIIVNTLMIYAHYFGFFIIITQFVFFIFHKTLITKYWKQLLATIIFIVLLYAPNIFIVLHRFVESSTQGTWVQRPNGIYSIIDMLRLFTNNPYGENFMEIGINNSIVQGIFKVPVTLFSALIIGLAIVKKVLLCRTAPPTIMHTLVVVWFALPFVCMFCVSYIVPMFLDRYLMPAAVAFSLILAVSADYIITNRSYKLILPAILCALFISSAKPRITNKRNVEETVAKIKEIKDSNTLVILSPAYFTLNFVYYYNQAVFKDYATPEIYSNINRALHKENIYGANNITEIDYKKWDTIIFLDAAANFSFPHNNIKQELDATYSLLHESHIPEIFNVYKYKAKE